MTLDTTIVDQLINEVTRQVCFELFGHTYVCHDCRGHCARHCPDRSREAVAAGADRLTATLGIGPVENDIARLIDHTLLKPSATVQQIAQLCHEAILYQFAAVCVNPAYVKLAAQLVRGSPVKVCTVIGFPLGATPTEVKVFETRQALDDGATEIDMVINIGALKSGDDELVERDIALVASTVHSHGAICKVILETAMLSDEEKVRACQLAKKARADFVKTSTGFGGGGATVHDVALMRHTVGPEMGIKASGGIGGYAVARQLIAAGATRLGASAGVKIVQEARSG
jgi:deoxyribose-phosphate aldolase